MRLTLRTLTALLCYPSTEVLAGVPELRQAIRDEGALPPQVAGTLAPLLDRLEGSDLLDAQAEYTDLFDRSRALSLHLFEHVHGENRDRGQAMIDLAHQYAELGLMLDTEELPDYLPVFLEAASCLPPEEAQEMLAQPVHVFAALEERLRDRESDYAGIFACLCALAGAPPDAEALEELRRATPDEDPARIDEEWEEKEVTFTGQHEMGGPTGMVAKLRAAGKARTAARRQDQVKGARS
jgi:nitrate reductase delta subunit